nr:hypothetical protein [Tanacetum cinerariifolium]
MSYLTDYKEIDGGYVAFGRNPKGGKITRKGQARMETEHVKDYILLPLWTADPLFSQDPKSSHDDGYKPSNNNGKKDDEDPRKENECKDQEKKDNVNNTNNVNTVSSTVNASGRNEDNELPFDPYMPTLEDVSIFNFLNNDVDDDIVADMNNMDTTIQVSPIITTRIHKDHPLDQVIGDLHSAIQTINMTKNLEKHGFVIHALKDSSWIEAIPEELLKFKLQELWTLVDLPYRKRAICRIWVFQNKKDERGIVIRNKARLVAQGHTQEEGIDYDEVFAPVARTEAIRLFLAYASFKDLVVYQMDVKSAFLYGKIEEEVYVCQPSGFEDPDFPDRVYKVEKALYILHQAPKAWYETLLTYLLDNGFQRGKIDKTYSSKGTKLMHEKFQMISIGELTFFLGLQVKQKKDGIFISQDKYVAKILKKFGFTEVKNASTPMETQKPLLKDEDGEEVDVHMYRYQVNPKVSHLYVVKRIIRNIRRIGKGFSGRIIPLFPTIVVQLQLGEGSAMPTDPHHTPTILQPSSLQPQEIHKPRKPKRNKTQVPQLNVPIESVVDEAVYKELDDSLVRAATTALSLEVEQDSGDTNRKVPINETFHEQTDVKLTKKELKQVEADDQAIQTILLGLPEEIYAAIDSYETAQEIWFTSTDEESIESYYHRFSKLMNDFKRNKHFPENIARIANQNSNVNGNVVAARAEDLDEIKEVNANFILMANLKQASTSGTQTDKASVYNLDGSAEGLPKIDETHALSKPVTSTSIPTPQESKVMKNDKVIAPGMFRINPFKPSREEKNVPNKVRANNTAKTRKPQPRSNTENDRVPYVSKSSCRKNKEVEVEEHPRNLLLSKNKKHMSSECYNVKLAIRNDKSKVVCAMCNQYLITANHDVCVLNYVNDMNSHGKKQKANVSNTENQKKQKLMIMKPKKVGSNERLASPKPSKPRSYLRTKKIIETMNVTFNELSVMDFKQSSSKPGLQGMTSRHISSGLDLTYAPSTITTQQPTEGELDLLFKAMYNDYICGQPSATPRTVLTKDHPLEKVIGEPSRPVLTRNQLRSDGDMCMYALTMIIMEPKNFKKATILDGLNQCKKSFFCLKGLIIIKKTRSSKQDSSCCERVPPRGRNRFEESFALVARMEAIRIFLAYAAHKSFIVFQMDVKTEFLPVARMEAIRIFLAYAAHKSFIVFQMDVKTEFFHGTLKEDMYVFQPEGFINDDHPNHIYKLIKALYRLKQAPRAWSDELSTFLLQNHFFKGTIDSTLFIRCFKDNILVVLVYVDDIIFGSTHTRFSDADYVGCKDTFKSTSGGAQFLDADYVGCKDTFKSTSGGAQFLGEKLVSWSLKKQDCMVLSTAEAEYVSLSACCAQVLWMRTQLTDYGFHFNKIPIYCNSKSAIAISSNPVLHSRTKHIIVRYHFIKEHVEKGTIELYFVKTDYKLADLFTKALLVD